MLSMNHVNMYNLRPHQLFNGFRDGVLQPNMMQLVVFTDLVGHHTFPHCRRTQYTQADGLERTHHV